MTQGGAASALFRGSGTTAVYGTSPAVDLLANGASPSESGSDTSTTVKLLVVAANDCRHMLKTIGDRWAVDGERRPLHVRVGVSAAILYRNVIPVNALNYHHWRLAPVLYH